MNGFGKMTTFAKNIEWTKKKSYWASTQALW